MHVGKLISDFPIFIEPLFETLEFTLQNRLANPAEEVDEEMHVVDRVQPVGQQLPRQEQVAQVGQGVVPAGIAGAARVRRVGVRAVPGIGDGDGAVG